jgi:hypothetical protein
VRYDPYMGRSAPKGLQAMYGTNLKPICGTRYVLHTSQGIYKPHLIHSFCMYITYVTENVK